MAANQALAHHKPLMWELSKRRLDVETIPLKGALHSLLQKV
jgi:hypothetical protein